MEGASCVFQVIAPPHKYGDKKIQVVTAKPIDDPSVANPPPAAPAPPAAEAVEAAPAPAPVPARGGEKPRHCGGGAWD